MTDLSQYTDAQLEQIASGVPQPSAQPTQQPDLASVPDAELEKIAGSAKPERGFFGRMMDNATDAMRSIDDSIQAGAQGTSPIVRRALGETAGKDNYRKLGDMFQSDIGNTFAQDGKWLPVDPTKHVTLRDPDTGGMSVYERNPQMAESGLLGLGRALSLGAGAGRLPVGPSAAPGAAIATAQRAEDFAKLGVPGTVADLTGNRTAQIVENAVKNVPGAAGVVQNSAKARVGAVGTAAEDIAAGLGSPANALEGGEALRRGGQNFLTDFKSTSDRLYKDLDLRLPPSTPVELSNTQAALAQTLGRFDNPELASEFITPQIKRINQALSGEGAGFTYRDIKQLRSEVGEKLSKPAITSDVNRAEYEALYGALSDDMKAAAAAKGPEALAAFERANGAYKAGMERINGPLKQLLTPSDTAEKTFANFTAKTQNAGARADIEGLRTIKKSVAPEDWNDVSAAIVREMGKRTPGAVTSAEETFSPGTFVTNYAKLSDNAKGLLFTKDSREALDRLARVSTALKDTERLTNTSNTAATVGTGAMGAGFIADPLTTVAAIVGANGTARLMTNPKFAQWLVGIKQMPPKTVTQASSRVATLVSSLSGTADGAQFGRQIQAAFAEDQDRPRTSN